MAHAQPREAAFFVEATFVETQADWDANGTEIYVIEPDVSGLAQQNLESENISPRRLFTHKMIRGLKSGSSVPLSMYMTATGANAVSQAPAVVTPQATIMKACLGGQKLGLAADFTGGTAAAPEIDADPGFVKGDPVFAYDTDPGEGEFYIFESIAALVVTFDRDLHFIPTVADKVHAVISTYPHEPALNDHADADNTTLGWLVQGEGTPDVYELQGCKPALEIEGITAGEPVKAAIDNMVTSFPDAPSKITFTTPPSGIAPNVPGTGCDSLVKIADVGGTLASVDTRDTITPNLGITWAADAGPNGCEGVHGYIAEGVGEGGPALTVDHATVYDTDWTAETNKQIYVQVGNIPTAAWGIYWPNAEYRSKPTRIDAGGVTSSSLDFRAQENTADATGLTGQDLSQRRAPFLIMIVA